MNCYLVVLEEDDDALLSRTFGADCVMRIRVGCWAVASGDRTCADVSERLGMNDETGRSGMVSRIGEYFGYYNRALWDRIEAWKSA